MATNSCSNCKFEKTCGYSHLAMLGYRTEYSYGTCGLGERSYGDGPFFQKKD
jgi:hypothetical protein